MYPGPALDPLTLLFSTAVMGFLMAAFAFGVSRAIPEHRRHLHLWGWAMTAAGGAFLLFYLRPHLPPALGYAAPNLLSVAVPWLVLEAHAGLVNWRAPTWIQRGAPAVAAAAVLAVPLAGLPAHWGAAMVCAAVALTAGTFAWLMGWHRTARSLPASSFLVGVGAVTALAFAWRTALAASGELPPIDSPTQTRQLGAVLSMFAGVVFIAAASITFLTMVHEMRHRAALHAARRDGLTGVLTRQAFFDLGEALLGHRPAGQTLMMVDLDHFKAVNDRLGHQAGDAVLTRMARLIASGTRDRDLVGRYGGEEFVLLLDDPDGAAPLTAAQRLVDRAEAAWLNDRAEGREHGPGAHCRLSVGVARRHPAEPLDALVGRADAALYAAKAAGRARAVLAP